MLEYGASLTRRARLDVAVRHDRNEHFRDATTYRVQASWLPGEATKLHVAAGSGIKNPTPTLGNVLNSAVNYAIGDFIFFFMPAAIIAAIVISFNLLGDGARDALDPKAGR